MSKHRKSESKTTRNSMELDINRICYTLDLNLLHNRQELLAERIFETTTKSFHDFQKVLKK